MNDSSLGDVDSTLSVESVKLEQAWPGSHSCDPALERTPSLYCHSSLYSWRASPTRRSSLCIL